jgi:serine protease
MSKIRIYLWVFAFFSIALSAATTAEQTLEEREPPTTKDEALSRLMEGLLREKSPLPLNTPSTPTATEATAEKAEHQDLEANTSHSQALQSPSKKVTIDETEHQNLKENTPPSQDSQSPPAIAVGIIVRFKSPEIQALARDNLPPPPEVVDELEAALGEKLVFERATVNEAYVFSFLVPKEGEKVIAAFLQPAKELPSIDWIEANWREQVRSSSVQTPSSMVQTQSFSSGPGFNFQWNMMGDSEGFLGGIDAVHAWDITHGSSDTIVAVVDTGVRPHPEFADRLLPGYDFISDSLIANDGDGRDNDASDPGDWTEAGECYNFFNPSGWHGTHVAGIIAASGEDGYGIAGVNWRTRILPVRVLGKCGGDRGDIAEGIQWAAGIHVPGVPFDNPYPAQVINLSLGSHIKGECPSIYQSSIDKALIQGALVVVAAGNEYHDSIKDYAPANCKGVMVVVATDLSGNLAPYSNTTDFSGVDIAIAAPGGYQGKQQADGTYPYLRNGILSTVDTGITEPEGFAYNWYEGTSMAAPHVSGIASLMLAINPKLSGAELLFWLKDATRLFPNTSFLCNIGSCGVGIADAYRSVINATVYKQYQLVYEFYNVHSKHYMLTGSKEDAAALYNGGEGLEGWVDTLKYFYAWSDPMEDAVPVHRFYTLGANSHFYTAKPDEYDRLTEDNKDNVYAYNKWTYEGIAFYAKLPINDICPANTYAIYRLYNGHSEQNDSNHRFVSSRKAYVDMRSKGWIGENVAFCVAAAIED